MERRTEKDGVNGIITIPNILSGIRLLLIPVIVWLYCFRKAYVWATAVLMVSGLTDIADGFIARHFHMISDLGKILDPVADKLTQGVTLVCLGTRFLPMLILGIALAVKEIVTGMQSLYVVSKTKKVKCADWHGKVVTSLLYLTMAAHILWVDIPSGVTVFMTALCLGMMCLSFALYLRRNLKQINENKIVRMEARES